MEVQRLTGLGKRRQIKLAGRTMFVWVAVASIVVAFAAVALQLLVAQWLFNSKVLDAKYKAASTLDGGLKSYNALKTNVNTLLGSNDLADARNAPEEGNLQVILDALPAKSDVTATATSIQQVIAPRSGVTLETINVPVDDQTSAVSTSTTQTAAQTNSLSVGTAVGQTFNVVVTGNYQSVQAFLKNLERTIRPMNVVNLTVGGNDSSLRATMDLVTYYQPTKSVTITKKAIK